MHSNADPVAFDDGVAVVWRVGDVGVGELKCNCRPHTTRYNTRGNPARPPPTPEHLVLVE